jgi:hypothetical protein
MTQMPLFPDLEKEKEYLPQVIPANLSPKQVSAEEQKILATSGRTYLELFNKNDLMYAFSKTLLATFPLALMKFSMIWKVRATQQGRLYCQLKRVVHRTEEIGSGSSQKTWATPTTMDHLPPRSEEATKKLQEGHRKGRSRPSNLREQVDEKTMMMWPTPTTKGYGHGSEGQYQNLYNKMMQGIITQKELEIMTATKMENHRSYKKMQKMWPTPTTRDHKGGYMGGRIKNGTVSNDTLDVAVQYTDNQKKESKQLNADWVEWLMGYPRGWTSL